jgi:hypothetical protein
MVGPCAQGLRSLVYCCSTFQHLRPAYLHCPPDNATTSHRQLVSWLRSLRFIGCRRVLQPSSSATMARGEVRHQTLDSSTGANNCVAFHPAQASLAAQNFNMPALSPTMTEGNIATWKIKEGTTNLHSELRLADGPTSIRTTLGQGLT